MSTIFVIGAGPQIGLHVAIRFAKGGFTSVGLASRSKSSLESLASQLPQGTKVAIADGTDASDQTALLLGLEKLEKNLGKPDVVVYNPSSLALGPRALKDLTAEEFEKHYRLTTTGALLTGQWATKKLKSSEQKPGTVIFTGGRLGHQPRPNMAGLAAGKAALINLTKSFQLEFPDIHYSTVTVGGFVDKGDEKYSSQRIAEEYWKLYEQKKANWQLELVY